MEPSPLPRLAISITPFLLRSMQKPPHLLDFQKKGGLKQAIPYAKPLSSTIPTAVPVLAFRAERRVTAKAGFCCQSSTPLTALSQILVLLFPILLISFFKKAPILLPMRRLPRLVTGALFVAQLLVALPTIHPMHIFRTV